MSTNDNNDAFNKARQQGKMISQLAMNDGLKIGAFFAIQAGALLLYNLGFLSTLIFLVATIGVPIVLYKLGVRFRDHQMDGAVRYMQIVGYLSWTYMFSLIVAFLAYYLVSYMLFNDATFISLMEESMAIFTKIYEDRGVNYEQAIAAVRGITPLQLAVTVTMNALFNGLIYIYIIGIFIKRSDNK